MAMITNLTLCRLILVVLVVNDHGSSSNLPLAYTDGKWCFAENTYTTLNDMISDLHTLELDSNNDGAPYVLSGSCPGAERWDEVQWLTAAGLFSL